MSEAQARAKARYESFRILLAGLLAAFVLASLGLIVVDLIEVRQQGDDAVLAREALGRQADQIEALLERQERADANRQTLIDSAVARIAASQTEALAAHDVRVQELLRESKLLLDQELNSPRNVERRPVAPPAP